MYEYIAPNKRSLWNAVSALIDSDHKEGAKEISDRLEKGLRGLSDYLLVRVVSMLDLFIINIEREAMYEVYSTKKRNSVISRSIVSCRSWNLNNK